jgi:parvulin-like peptidyl-prolyl isomerase
MKPEQEQVWARHILVADEAAAKAVIQRLAAGEDFAKIAAEVSTDTGSKTQGGDLGWFGRGTMSAPFEESAFSLETGKISQPIQSEFGWHVIQVLGHEVRPLNSTDFAALKTKFFNDLITAAEAKSQIQKFTDLLQQIVPVEPVIPPGILVPTQAPIQ